MPWRKYPSIEGMYGPIFNLCKGIKVRRDWRRQWIVDINVKGQRGNRAIGAGREGLVKAIKAAEAIVIWVRLRPKPLRSSPQRP